MTSQIILLNGVGSVGKSSIAKALQESLIEPFLHVQMDTFLEMLPDKFENHNDSFSFNQLDEGGHPSIEIKSGPVGEKLMDGMRLAMAALARAGNNLIIDDVIFDESFAEYKRLFSSFTLHTVGLFAPLDILEQREKQRGGRMLGLSRWQYDQVHKGKVYDLEIDTSGMSPTAATHLIIKAFSLQN
jgi:chloramphenicol 3-O phosphotransferase